MFASGFRACAGRVGRVAAAALTASVIAASAASADEITVRIDRVRALDKIDSGLAGQADFYAIVTIAGEEFRTKVARGKDDLRPGWVFRKRVSAGKHDVKIRIFDRDPLKADTSVDVNRVDNKRDLDFAVDTRSCIITGFSTPQRCGRTINRSGQEKKKAEIWFRVNAR
ncbi:MAG: hypothetical protein R3D27_13715 [Hyphomicrobiaceae bacterium]